METAEFILRVPLMSKARPRFAPGQSRPYMPTAYKKWQQDVRALLAEWWAQPPLEDVICLSMVFYGPGRGDTDNLAGAVMDAGTGVVWSNDRVTVIKRLEAEWVKSPIKDQSILLTVIYQ